MAHDFSITSKENEEGKVTVYLFGRSFKTYESFGAMRFNAGVSGCNDGCYIDAATAEKGIEKILSNMRKENEQRADILRMYDIIKNSDDDDKFYIHFS